MDKAKMVRELLASQKKRKKPAPVASYSSAPVDTNKESALRDKKAITEAYRRRRREARQTRWGSKLWT